VSRKRCHPRHRCAVPACPATGHPAVTPEWHNIPAFFTFDPIALENWYADDESSSNWKYNFFSAIRIEQHNKKIGDSQKVCC
jgi:hypothetical protein